MGASAGSLISPEALQAAVSEEHATDSPTGAVLVSAEPEGPEEDSEVSPGPVAY